MGDVISEYQKWKQQGDSLRTQARQAMEARFRELLSEAVSIAEEYRADFGAPMKPPSSVTAFRFKASGRNNSKKARKETLAKPGPREEKAAVKSGGKIDPKVARLRRQLETARKKLEDAKAAGNPTRSVEDRIYEIEDALRLAGQTA